MKSSLKKFGEQVLFVLKKLGGHFVYGILTLLPILITLWVIGWLALKINDILGARSPLGNVLAWISSILNLPHYSTLLISYVILILLIAAFGYLVRRYASIRFQDKAKSVFEHFPVVNTIYNTAEQVVGFVSKKDSKLDKFGEIVIVNFANLKVIGFLASRKSFLIDGIPHVIIYFPSTPMPITGFNYLVPLDDVYETDISFEELSKVILSLGALAPQVLGDVISTKKISDDK